MIDTTTFLGYIAISFMLAYTLGLIINGIFSIIPR